MNTFALAYRNLLRNRRRSIATLLAIALGSIAILLFGGYSKNITYSMQTAYVAFTGHLQVQHKSFYLYGSGNPTAYGIADYDRIIKAIQTDDVLRDMVLVVTPTLQFGGIAGNYAAGVSRTISGTGLAAADYGQMRLWNDYHLPIDNKRFALDGSPPDSAIIGIGVARVLQLCDALKIVDCPKPVKEAPADGKAMPDDIAQLGLQETPAAPTAGAGDPPRIELLASNSRGTPNVASLNVILAQNQGFKELDEVYVQMHLTAAQRLIYGKEPPRVTAIMVQLRHTSQVPVAQARIAALLAGSLSDQPLAVLNFEALNPFYQQTINLFDTIFGFMFVLMGGIVLFTVGNTVNTAVVERTVEIGTLRAIGLRRSGIRRLFVTEGLMLGVFGSVLGALIAVAASLVINVLGLTWLPPGTSNPVPLTIRVWGEPAMVFGTTAGLIVITTLSAIWPSYRAAKMGMVDALRHA